MKDPFLEAVAPPTPAQLKAANMVLLPNAGQVAVKNGYRRRIWSGKSFILAPPTTTIDTPLYAVANYETPNVPPSPAPTPTPAPVPVDPHPSGFAIPDPEPGFKRAALDDFISKTWSSIWGLPPYNSVSKAAQDGIFLTSHAVLRGDSLLRMECYPDPEGAKNGWQISQALIDAVNAWATAGVQTATRWPVGTTFTWAGKWDTYPGITAINLLMSDGWTSEEDLTEAGGIAIKGSPDNQYEVTFMTGQGSNKVQEPTNNTGQDFSQWHVWQVKWTLQGTTITCDGKLVASTNFVNNANQFWTIQPQTGDPNTPGPDASITAANPVTQYLDWIAIDVPTLATRSTNWFKRKLGKSNG